jgi:hypothetical protein
MIQETYRGFAGQKLVPKKAIQEISQPPIHPTPENPFTPTAEAPAAGPACRLSSRRLMVLGLGAGGATSLGLGVGLGKQKNALTALNTTQVPTAAPAIDDICGLDLTAAPATEDFFGLGLTGAPVGLSLEDIFGLGLTDSPTAEASITETPIMSAPTTLTPTTKLDLRDAPSASGLPYRDSFQYTHNGPNSKGFYYGSSQSTAYLITASDYRCSHRGAGGSR